jgi:threonine dehydrogenase-like Zn-dependent dehydrogenase
MTTTTATLRSRLPLSQHREFVGGAQAELLRVPLADGTLVATPDQPDPEMLAFSGAAICALAVVPRPLGIGHFVPATLHW